jgi:acetyl esterase/lipase
VISPRVEVIDDITSAGSNLGPLKLDPGWPASGGPYPVAVHCRGGGWGVGDKAMISHRLKLLAQCGYVIFNANCRLSPAARFPAG